MNVVSKIIEIEKKFPDKLAFVFPDGEGESTTNLTYKELLNSINLVSGFISSSLEPKRFAILVYSNASDFIISFFSCLQSGLIAVPLNFPKSSSAAEHLVNVSNDCESKLLLTSKLDYENLLKLEKYNVDINEFEIIFTDDFDEGEYIPPMDMNNGGNDVAFVQYTSGSTGNPKGVVIAHDNLYENVRYLEKESGSHNNDVFVNWLPSHHDLGLVTTIVLPVFLGATSVIFSPISFIKRPRLWLELITKFKGTIAGAPNFAFARCLERMKDDDLEGIDLTSWRIAFNAAEPVSGAVLVGFSQKFSCVGFRHSSFYPSYGMAETTAFFSGSDLMCGPTLTTFNSKMIEKGIAILEPDEEQGRTLVGCGDAGDDHKICIVDSKTNNQLQDGKIGEIWVSGPSVSRGYLNRQDINKKYFNNRLVSDNIKDFYLTGDLGFKFNGNLYITGRIKDVMIFNGRNYYPTDIEAIVDSSHDAIISGTCAAFSIADNNEVEKLAIVVEVNQRKGSYDPDTIRNQISSNIFSKTGLNVSVIAFIRRGTCLKTSSGKIKRSQTKANFLSGSIDLVDSNDLPANIDSQLHNSISDKENFIDFIEKFLISLNKPAALKINPNHRLSTLGFDSIFSIELMHEIQKHYAQNLPIDYLMGDTTIGELASLIESKKYAIQSIFDPMPFNESFNIENHRAEASEEQKGVWLSQELNPESKALFIHKVVKVKSSLDITKLNASFNDLLLSHNSLTSTFEMIDGILYQKLNPNKTIDIINYSIKNKENAVNEIANLTRDLSGNIKLDKYPLFSVITADLDGEFLLSVSIHHILIDFISSGLFMNELFARYSGVYYLPENNNAMINYALSQKAFLAGERAIQARGYWSERVNKFILNPDLQYPYDFLQGNNKRKTYAVITQEIDNDLASKINNFCTYSAISPSSLFLSVYQLALHKWCSQKDITVGVTAIGRNNSKFRNSIGYFINILPISSHFTGDMTVSDFLKTTSNELIGALKYQEVPFSVLRKREILEANSFVRLPQLSTTYTYLKGYTKNQTNDLTGFALNNSISQNFFGFEVKNIPVTVEEIQYDLKMLAGEFSGGYQVSLEYNESAFNRRSIKKVLDIYFNLLNLFVKNIGLIDFEKIRNIYNFNNTESSIIRSSALAASSSYDNIAKYIDNVAQERPDAIALVEGNKHISYSELNKRANQLANFLLSYSDIPETPLVICLDKTIYAVLAVIATRKARWSYLSINSDSPIEWTTSIIENLNPKLIVTLSIHDDYFKNKNNVVLLDKQWSSIDRFSSHPSKLTSDFNEIAYFCTTSGTTGRPKTIMGTNGAIVSYIDDLLNKNNFANSDIGILRLGFEYDASIRELYTILSSGGRLVLSNQIESIDTLQYWKLLVTQHVSIVMSMVPTFLRALLKDYSNLPAIEKITSSIFVSKIFISGEVLLRSDFEATCAVFGNDVKLTNLYGPSECTMTTTSYNCNFNKPNSGQLMPIGSPRMGAAVYILDENFNPSGIGSAGELYISGHGITRGYLNSPGQTALSYIPDPFSDVPGQRMFKTGDQAKVGEDSEIDFLGRNDSQIKLRGNRIELEAISSVILNYPGVKNCCTLDELSDTDRLRIISYVEIDRNNLHDQSLLIAGIKEYVKQKLPLIMVPSNIYIIDRIPINGYGKNNISELRKIRHEYEGSIQCPPSNIYEECVFDIWKSVLGIHPKSIYDTFISLGADSIDLIKVMAKINKTYNLQLTINQLIIAESVFLQARKIQDELKKNSIFFSNTDSTEKENTILI